MHDLVMKTVDKVSFKINIPILISIVVGTATIYWSYITILNKIESISLAFQQHNTENTNLFTSIKEDQKETRTDINDLKTRVAVIEKLIK